MMVASIIALSSSRVKSFTSNIITGVLCAPTTDIGTPCIVSQVYPQSIGVSNISHDSMIFGDRPNLSVTGHNYHEDY